MSGEASSNTTREWSWDESLFAGAARFYELGRPPYAPGLAEALRTALRLDGSGRLLDLGCGPGTVALLLAHLYTEVVGLDPDRDMLEEARRLAAERGIGNASWVQLRAEELPAGLGAFRTVTLAASFHWMNRPTVAAAVREMLDLGGSVIHIDNRYQEGTDPLPGDPHPAVPSAAIVELRRAYLGSDTRAGQSLRNISPDREDLVFFEAGFVGPEVVVVPGWGLVERTIEEVVANVFSISASAPHLFGARMSSFEADLRSLLTSASPSGRFSLRLPDNHLNIWRRR